MAKSKGFTTGHDESVGKGSFSNLPQEVIHKEYPPCRNYKSGMLDDTMTDIDDIADRTEGTSRKHVSYQK